MYDVIVIGTGGIGSAALYHLATCGMRVLGLDRFPAGHDRGSSHGESRMIRKSYFEHPDYVPLACQSWDMWQQLEQRAGRSLLKPSGVVYYGRPDGVVMSGVRDSAAAHGLPVEDMSPADAADRFPQFQCPPATTALFEADAGILLVEDCVTTHIQLAVEAGAEIVDDVTVRHIAAGPTVTVTTDRGTCQAGHVIVTAGAWSAGLLADLQLPLRVIRKHLHWFHCDNPRLHLADGCPAFFVEHQGGYFYGLPQMGPSGLKAGEHSGGAPVSDPLTDPRAPESADVERVEKFVSDFLVTDSCTHQQQKTCFYTMTPDENFVLDHHPEHANVVYAAGFSGHGFKFAPVMGQRLAEMVTAPSDTSRLAKLTGFLTRDRFRTA